MSPWHLVRIALAVTVVTFLGATRVFAQTPTTNGTRSLAATLESLDTSVIRGERGARITLERSFGKGPRGETEEQRALREAEFRARTKVIEDAAQVYKMMTEDSTQRFEQSLRDLGNASLAAVLTHLQSTLDRTYAEVHIYLGEVRRAVEGTFDPAPPPGVESIGPHPARDPLVVWVQPLHGMTCHLLKRPARLTWDYDIDFRQGRSGIVDTSVLVVGRTAIGGDGKTGVTFLSTLAALGAEIRGTSVLRPIVGALSQSDFPIIPYPVSIPPGVERISGRIRIMIFAIDREEPIPFVSYLRYEGNEEEFAVDVD